MISSMLTPHWIELKSTKHRLPMSTIDYDLHADDYLSPKLTMNDVPSYEVDDRSSQMQYQTGRRLELQQSHVQRVDTSTESSGVNYTSIVPKSILKGRSSATPPFDRHSIPLSQTTSKYDDSPRTSVRINMDPTVRIDDKERQSIIDPFDSMTRMQFAHVNRLNEIPWEMPREFRNSSNDILSIGVDRDLHISRLFIPWTHYSDVDRTQQQAFEY
jgi:hypothetical protein